MITLLEESSGGNLEGLQDIQSVRSSTSEDEPKNGVSDSEPAIDSLPNQSLRSSLSSVSGDPSYDESMESSGDSRDSRDSHSSVPPRSVRSSSSSEGHLSMETFPNYLGPKIMGDLKIIGTPLMAPVRFELVSVTSSSDTGISEPILPRPSKNLLSEESEAEHSDGTTMPGSFDREDCVSVSDSDWFSEHQRCSDSEFSDDLSTVEYPTQTVPIDDMTDITRDSLTLEEGCRSIFQTPDPFELPSSGRHLRQPFAAPPSPCHSEGTCFSIYMPTDQSGSQTPDTRMSDPLDGILRENIVNIQYEPFVPFDNPAARYSMTKPSSSDNESENAENTPDTPLSPEASPRLIESPSHHSLDAAYGDSVETTEDLENVPEFDISAVARLVEAMQTPEVPAPPPILCEDKISKDPSHRRRRKSKQSSSHRHQRTKTT